MLFTLLFVRYVLDELEVKETLKDLPENKALEGLSGALVEALEKYDQTKK